MFGSCCSSQEKYSSKMNSKISFEIKERNTFSEKAGMIVTSAISELVKAIQYSFNKSAEGYRFAAEKIDNNPVANRIINFVHQNIFKPIKDVTKKSFSCALSKARACMNKIDLSGAEAFLTKTAKKLNERVLTPLSEKALKPALRQGKRIVEMGKPHLERAVKLLNENALKPALRLGKNVLKTVKPHVNTTTKALKNRILKPSADAAKKLFNAVKPILKRAFKPLNEHVFKPAVEGVHDFFYGIFRGAAIGQEASEEELKSSLSKEYQEMDFSNEETLKSFLKDVKISDEDKNFAMALYLKQVYKLVIDKNWLGKIRSERLENSIRKRNSNILSAI